MKPGGSFSIADSAAGVVVGDGFPRSASAQAAAVGLLHTFWAPTVSHREIRQRFVRRQHVAPPGWRGSAAPAAPNTVAICVGRLRKNCPVAEPLSSFTVFPVPIQSRMS
jgi:hypothetical protein